MKLTTKSPGDDRTYIFAPTRSRSDPIHAGKRGVTKRSCGPLPPCYCGSFGKADILLAAFAWILAERQKRRCRRDHHAAVRKILVVPIPALSQLQAGPLVQLLDSLDPDERSLSLLWSEVLSRVGILRGLHLHQLRRHCGYSTPLPCYFPYSTGAIPIGVLLMPRRSHVSRPLQALSQPLDYDRFLD
jgi:hypothetical protein